MSVPIRDELRRTLDAAVSPWREEPDAPEMRWTDPASWHVTLAFMAATAAKEVPRIADALRDAAAGHTAFSLPTGGLGAFPRAQYARVVWYGILDDGRLAALAGSVCEALGVDEGVFRAHVTLGRQRRPSSVESWLLNHEGPASVVPIEDIDLIRSFHGRGAIRYQRLTRVLLRAG